MKPFHVGKLLMQGHVALFDSQPPKMPMTHVLIEYQSSPLQHNLQGPPHRVSLRLGTYLLGISVRKKEFLPFVCAHLIREYSYCYKCKYRLRSHS